MTEPAEYTTLRIPKTLNEKLKGYSETLGASVTDFAIRSLEAIMTQMDGDEQTPLLIAEYKLKKSYAAGAKKKGKK